MAYTTEEKVETLLLEDISATTTPTTTQVTQMITWAEDEINALAGGLSDEQLFESTLVSSETHSYDGEGFIRVDKGPIISVDSIYYDKAGFNASATNYQLLVQSITSEGDYYLDEYDSKMIRFKPSTSGNAPTKGVQALKVTYKYGYSTVPTIIEELASAMVVQKILGAKLNNNSFSSQDSISIGPISISKANVTAGNLKQLKDYIKDLKSQVGTFQVKGRGLI